MDKRYKQLREIGKSGLTSTSVSSQNFLANSVEHPWERSITLNKVPYYIK